MLPSEWRAKAVWQPSDPKSVLNAWLPSDCSTSTASKQDFLCGWAEYLKITSTHDGIHKKWPNVSDMVFRKAPIAFPCLKIPEYMNVLMFFIAQVELPDTTCPYSIVHKSMWTRGFKFSHHTCVLMNIWTRTGVQTGCNDSNHALRSSLLKSDFQWAQKKMYIPALQCQTLYKLHNEAQTFKSRNKKKRPEVQYDTSFRTGLHFYIGEQCGT